MKVGPTINNIQGLPTQKNLQVIDSALKKFLSRHTSRSLSNGVTLLLYLTGGPYPDKDIGGSALIKHPHPARTVALGHLPSRLIRISPGVDLARGLGADHLFVASFIS